MPPSKRNIPEPSEYLEHRFRQSNQATINSSKALLKAQLKAGNHTLTEESYKAIVRKYDWQFCLQPTLF
jgi:hypothetical protein